ncbi:hypothetical protein NBRC10512_000393 [Rhodotorula toruloides]
MPQFVKQRESYEVRERPSRTYSWIVFMLTNILIELVWNTLMAVIMYFCLYYPVGFYNNAEPGKLHERGALFFLLVLAFMLFTSTFAHWMISFNETAENGGNIANLLFSLSLVFCGVLATPDVFPGFYIWVYYASPFRYLAEALLATGVGGTRVQCATSELLSFPPPGGSTCGDYMATYIQAAGGYLVDPSSTSHCQFCSISDTNTFLKTFNYDYDHRWRDFGIMWIYIAFNVAAAILCYWLARMPKNPRKSRAGKKSKKADEKDVLSHGDANGASEKQVSTNTN